MGFDYDAMIAKLCAWAPTRAQAVQRMQRALAEYEVRGLTTNLDFQRQLLRVEDFVLGHYDTGFIEQHREALLGAPPALAELDEARAVAVLVAALAERGRPAPGVAPGAPPGEREAPSAWAASHRRRRLGL